MKYTVDFRAGVVADYVSGLNTYEVAAKHSVPQPTVVYWVNQAGLMRDATAVRRAKYTLREDAFANAENDPEAAYWVGMMMADGNVSMQNPKSPAIQLGLSEADLIHVERFRSFVGSNHTIGIHRYGGFKTKYQLAAIRFRSARIAADLAKYGVGPNKSLTAIAPDCLKESPHFWRGMVDGDGWVKMYQRPHHVGPYPEIGLTGNRACVEQFANFIASLVAGKPGAVCGNGKTVFMARATGTRAAALAKVLYQGEVIALERKMAVAKQAMLWTANPHKGRKWKKSRQSDVSATLL